MKTSIKIIAVLFASQIFLCSCPKNTECKAVVTCKDQNGNAVKGADVILYAEVKPSVKGDIKAHGVTDANGKVSFVFKLPAIFDVDATVNSKTSTGIIKLEEGKTAEETIIVQ